MNDQVRDSFLGACGSAGPLVLGVEEPGISGVSWRVFDQPFAVAGRDQGANLHLNDPAISRRHAYFQVVDGRLFCVDLQSRTGTFWNDERGLWGWVDPEVGIRLGPYRIRPRAAGVGLDSTDLPLPVSRAYERPALTEVALTISGRTSGPTTWQASRALVLIGRSPACKIRLHGEGIANIHAAIVRTARGAFAVDLLGQGGLRVNGEEVRWTRLEERDELSIGHHRIQVRLGIAAPERRPLDEASHSTLPALTAGQSLAAQEGPIARPAVARTRPTEQASPEAFQESVLGVLQSLVAIQQEQMALIREELAQIRQIAGGQQVGQVLQHQRVLRVVNGPAPAPSGRAHSVRNLGQTPGGPPPPVADPVEEEKFHAQVFDRLDQIQKERLSGWQRLRGSILGNDS